MGGGGGHFKNGAFQKPSNRRILITPDFRFIVGGGGGGTF